MSNPVKWQGDDVSLHIHAQPSAKHTAFAGLHGEALKIRVAAPAQEGAANRVLCRFLAEEFAVPLAAVTLQSGENARTKRVKICSPKRWPQVLSDWEKNET